ncbi:MAG: dienelactone hydrolase family protein [Pseudomonadota bacterium]
MSLVTVPDAALSGDVAVEAVVLMYPWCGLASRARFSEWRNPAPVLFILAREDTIAPAYECRLIAQAMQDDGVDVEVMVFDDVTHGFDQVDHGSLSTLAFDAEATAAAIERAVEFVDEAHQARPVPTSQ